MWPPQLIHSTFSHGGNTIAVWDAKGTMWTLGDSRRLAAAHVSGMGARWAHLASVGRTAEALAANGLVPESVICAAWLHDIGYAPTVARTGFHPLDGAWFLSSLGVPDEIVGLVAFHTGATEEADERGLAESLQAYPIPDPVNLDLITMMDLATGPDGSAILDRDRIDEIFSRYPAEHPVHRAVSRSSSHLLASSARAKGLLGLVDDWPI